MLWQWPVLRGTMSRRCSAVPTSCSHPVRQRLAPPPPRLGATGDPVFNLRWMLLHLPCVNVPAHADDSGLPVGVQLIARRGADELLLVATAWVEAALQLRWRPPDGAN